MALYRKYRPATFAEVVGQEQVTQPLSAALDTGRINHAYLFSGPRGCGKTSSARIMARSLNCVQGPTSTPCGQCASCISLAPGGPGNLDVTELDAASHNSVEDMRELRERAYYAPADSRYRIFIIDEAHMVTNQGFNALLKIVEEPPEHLIFIFATTEPDKVIGTIRSRTHHYPFRLLTPPAMKGLLERTVASEGLYVEDSVYPMVISAGGGSPRDTLSILDQLLAGSGPDGLTYDIARPLLGVTDVTLLDDTIAALAQGDKAALFKHVDSVIEAGHEPRRFAVDLLERLRDLMILQAVPDAIAAGLVDAPVDRGQILTEQAQLFNGVQLAHYAATVNEQIGALRGATSPRLLLEILCAHLVMEPASTDVASVGVLAPAQSSATGATGNQVGSSNPGQQSGQQTGQAVSAVSSSSANVAPGSPNGAPSGMAAAQQAAAAIAARRNQQREQNQPGQSVQQSQVNQPSQQPRQAPTQPTTQPTTQPVAQQSESQPAPQQQQPAVPNPAQSQQEPSRQEQAWQQEAPQPEQFASESAQQQTQPQPQPEPAAPVEQSPAPAPASAPAPSAETAPASVSPEELVEQLRNNWQRLRASVSKRNKIAGIMLTEARVLGFKDDTLILGHTTGALAERLNAPANNKDVVAVVSEEAGREVAVNCIVGTDPQAAGFTAQKKKPETWNPGATNNASRETSDDDQEPESPRDYNNPAAPNPVDQSVENHTPENNAPAQEQPSGWGTPRAIGGSVPGVAAPNVATSNQDSASQTAPAQAAPQYSGPAQQAQTAQPAPSASAQATADQSPVNKSAEQKAEPAPDWRARIAQAKAQTQQREEELRNSDTFSDGRPLPPDPGPEEYPDYESVPPEEAHHPQQSAPQGGFGGFGQQQPPVQAQQAASQGVSQNAAPAQSPAPTQAPQSAQPSSSGQSGQPSQPAPSGRQLAQGARTSVSNAYSREAQENEMMDDAREQGQLDRRSATEVAMELLAKELGARKL